MATVDPREIITPEAFTVAPELLGRPLARPLRRGAAILLDLLLVAMLVGLGGRMLFLIAAGWFLLRYTGATKGGRLRRFGRVTLVLLGLLFFYLAARSAWNGIAAWLGAPTEPSAREAPRGIATGREGVAALGEVVALRRARSEEQAQPLADRLAERLHTEGTAPEEIRATILEAAGGGDRPWSAQVADRALRGVAQQAPDTAAEAELTEDSLVLAYAAALQAEDSARIAALRPQLEQTLAAEQVTRLERRTTRLERSNQQLRGELEEARDGWGILRLLRTLADELGLGFGWSGLYFTAFTALWEGQTPGKRLLRIRVLRLDGKPMGWWMSFERFGGYAAGFATGLLGFLQVFWDRNRQGIHDKITETVVVRL